MTDLSIFDMTNRKGIVTGAGKGIGKAIAIALAKAGANVVVCARTLSDVERTAAEIKKFAHTGHVPWVAGLPFFMVIFLAFFISLLLRHFTQ